MYLIKVPDNIEVKNANAKATELDRFKEIGVYKEKKNREEFLVSSRLVIIQKEQIIKARLVARGFEELESNASDAPTAAVVASKRIFLMLTASFGWKLETVDIPAAFLQADAIMIYV